ncbi:hypothetical protein BGZ95_011559 [Linnemannia exigua]|uniref:F-box domain-containing protein n=1 Tax=Linnemannia exigua TaxID=604196 RepID=A0AAD4H5J0_9FUNG|nr:hypothetical protein BGZ95_011559 [Linnemannia exigua]
MRVNKSWQALARPHHWRSFRSVPHRYNATQLPQIAAFIVPLVRSLTLNVFHTATLDVPFSNLVRLHLHLENYDRAVTSGQEAGKALALVCRNTRLQELRVKCAWRLLKKLDSSALQFLCSPRLRVLELEGVEYFCLEKVQAILAHCPDTLQELRIAFSHFEDLGYDDDDYPLRLNARATALPRVLPNLRVLILDSPKIDESFEGFACDLIQSSPRLHDINMFTLGSLSNILTALIKNNPSVNTVNFRRTQNTSKADLLQFLARSPKLRSLAIDHIEDHTIPILVDRFGSTLQELIIHQSNVPPNSYGFIATILAHCSCLKKLSVSRYPQLIDNGIDLQDLLAIEWASTSLESLCLPIKRPGVEIEQDHLLQEWRQLRYMYLIPNEYDPDGMIARSRGLVDLLSQFYRRLQAQPRLTSLRLLWHRMWYAIPLEFAEAFSNGQLTEKRLRWMVLLLSPLYTAYKIVRSAAKKRKEAEEERALMDKLNACNIFVVHVEASRMECYDNKDDEVNCDPSWLSDDQEYSTYKSRKERTRRAQRK